VARPPSGKKPPSIEVLASFQKIEEVQYMPMPKLGEELGFYDVKGKKKFKAKQWKVVTKKGRKFAVAKAPSGIEAYRILGKA
jgi:hypothetical protein